LPKEIRMRLPTSLTRMMLCTGLLGLTLTTAGASSVDRVAPVQGAAAQPYPVEYYYQVKWGYFDEFMELYKRNHYPILVRQQKLGRILRMDATYPVYHAGEAKRWDMRFTIVWKDAATAHDEFDSSGIIKELYPDQEKFRKEEQRRFELLAEHMDVPVSVDDLAQWGQ
jgi:hypothetical protein